MDETINEAPVNIPRAQRIANLAIGESETMSIFLPLAGATNAGLHEAKKVLSNRMRQSVHQANAKTGGIYETTTGESLTEIAGGGFIVTASAVRVA